jgi:hypothetical protein
MVMDVSAHSVLLHKPLSTNTQKADIMAWLSGRNIQHTASQTRTDSLQLFEVYKPQYNIYKLDLISPATWYTQ